MKTIYLILFLFINALLTNGQSIQSEINFPGFVQINDSVFISKYEVSIRFYGHFLAIMQRESGDTNFLQKAMPDPNNTTWTLWSNYNKNLTVYDSIYNRPNDSTISFTGWTSNWPIVNITKEQAEMYCSFKTKDYQLFYQNLKAKAKKKLPENLYFRLPTKAEWSLAANATSKQKLPVCKDLYESDTTGQSHPMELEYGLPNQLGIYNILGNVSEMVTDSDSVFGGSYLDSLIYCRPDSQQSFQKNNATGFRIVAVITQSEAN